MQSFSYSSAAPLGYHCSRCGERQVKLWRQYQTLACQVDLLCGDCAVADQNERGSTDTLRPGQRVGDDGKIEGLYGRSDQIGWLVPAVPTEDGETFWGYTSVPDAGCKWWKSLSTRKKEVA